jgi:hypothetical protein
VLEGCFQLQIDTGISIGGETSPVNAPLS